MTRTKTSLLAAVALASCLLAAPSSAQCPPNDDSFEDNDTCATAAPISATTHPGLVVFGSPCGYDPDYYSLSLASGEQVTFDLYFTHANGDINVFLYDATASCPGPTLASSGTTTDNESVSHVNLSGAPMNLVLFVHVASGAVAGNTYNLDVITSTVLPDPCSLPDDSYEDNDSCTQAAPITDGTYTDLWVSAPTTTGGYTGDFDFYATTIPAGGTLVVDIAFIDAHCDVDLFIWDPTATCGGSTTGSLDSSRGTQNTESCSYVNTGSDLPVVIEVRVWRGDQYQCALYDMTISGGTGSSGVAFCFGDGSDGVGCPCGNGAAAGSGEGCLNGTGLGCYLSGSGTASVSADTLVLTVNQAAPGDFGIFVQNIALAAAPAPFYNGGFCLAGDANLVRHYSPPTVQPTVTDAAGTGVNAQPMTAGDFLNQTQPGVTVHYQFWYRDNAGPCGTGANFSAGLSLPWSP